MHDLRSRGPVAARALLGDMRSVAQARGEAPLWELWAEAAVLYVKSRRPDAARAYFEE
jgi:hypothetical protein